MRDSEFKLSDPPTIWILDSLSRVFDSLTRWHSETWKTYVVAVNKEGSPEEMALYSWYIGASNPGWDDGCTTAASTAATKEMGAGDDADTSLGLRLNKLHDVHLSYPLPLIRQQLLKWLIRRARGCRAASPGESALSPGSPSQTCRG